MGRKQGAACGEIPVCSVPGTTGDKIQGMAVVLAPAIAAFANLSLYELVQPQGLSQTCPIAQGFLADKVKRVLIINWLIKVLAKHVPGSALLAFFFFFSSGCNCLSRENQDSSIYS